MKKFLKSKKGVVLLLTAVAAVVSVVGAYAYFTSSGNGSGTATVGVANNQVYVSGSTSGTLYPGGAARTVSFTAKNFSADTAQSISKIHLSNIQACVGSWSAPDLSAWPVVAPACPDTLPADLTADAACGSFSTGASNDTSKDFYMADTTVNPSSVTDGNLAASADRALASTGTIVMNDTSTNQDACKSKNLLLTFTTT